MMTWKAWRKRRQWSAALQIFSAVFLAVPLSGTVAHGSSWVVGDVFAGVGDGSYDVYDNSGAFKETISDGLGEFTTGCAFDSAGDLYTTNFTANQVVKYDGNHPHAILQSFSTPGTTGAAEAENESIAFDRSGNFYVGHATGAVHKYNAIGTLLQEFNAAIEDRGTDWIDLAADQTTLFYTSEGGQVKRYDVGSDTQLPNFGSIGGTSYALRLLPPGDGSGGLLVANSADIKRLDSGGNVVQSYDVLGEDFWFALNLDPNGTSFWSGDSSTSNFYRFDIASGAVEIGPIAAAGDLFGLCLLGEPTAGTGPAVGADAPTLGGTALTALVLALAVLGILNVRTRPV